MMNILQVAAVLAATALVNGAYRHGVVRAKAVILPNCMQIPPYKVTGTVQITQKVLGGPTYFRVYLEGFPPKSPHGFHVHVSGDILTNGCKSARGHYNPFGNTHGGPEDRKRHVGDLGNVYADAQGKVFVTIVDTKAGLVGENSIAGRAFVVHALKDDLGRGVGAQMEESLKTGNAGARVACGVIVYK